MIGKSLSDGGGIIETPAGPGNDLRTKKRRRGNHRPARWLEPDRPCAKTGAPMRYPVSTLARKHAHTRTLN